MVRDGYFERYAQKSQNVLPKSNMFISNSTKDIPVSEKESIFFCETDPIFCLEVEMEFVYPRNTLRALWSSFNMRQCIPDRIGIWQCWFLRRGENRST